MSSRDAPSRSASLNRSASSSVLPSIPIQRHAISRNGNAPTTFPTPVNLTGIWKCDMGMSDSLRQLIEYHREAASNTPSSRRSSVASPSSRDVTPDSTPPHPPRPAAPDASNRMNSNVDDQDCISILHKPTKLTFIFGELNTVPAVKEEYPIDGSYHWIYTHNRGEIAARCYSARSHQQSVLIDTRCTNKYELERKEYFLMEGNQTLVEEIRLLTCDPERINKAKKTATFSSGVASPFESKQFVVAKNHVVVKEILLLKRIYRRVQVRTEVC